MVLLLCGLSLYEPKSYITVLGGYISLPPQTHFHTAQRMMIVGRDMSMIVACISVLREVLHAILMPASSTIPSSAPSTSSSQCMEEWSVQATYALGFIQLIGVFYSLSVAFKNMLMIGTSLSFHRCLYYYYSTIHSYQSACVWQIFHINYVQS